MTSINLNNSSFYWPSSNDSSHSDSDSTKKMLDENTSNLSDSRQHDGTIKLKPPKMFNSPFLRVRRSPQFSYQEPTPVSTKSTLQRSQIDRKIFDAEHTELLKKKQIRDESMESNNDSEADNVWKSDKIFYDFMLEKFNRNSFDNKGSSLISTVHYGNNYNGAEWRPADNQVVYGDGHSDLYNSFTKDVDVTAHEIMHGIIQHERHGMDQLDQSGAIQESLADVFAAMTKQYSLNQKARDADWIIGENVYVHKPGTQKGIRCLSGSGYTHHESLTYNEVINFLDIKRDLITEKLEELKSMLKRPAENSDLSKVLSIYEALKSESTLDTYIWGTGLFGFGFGQGAYAKLKLLRRGQNNEMSIKFSERLSTNRKYTLHTLALNCVSKLNHLTDIKKKMQSKNQNEFPPKHMDNYIDFKVIDYDKNGVHFNCGIPNAAFQKAATDLGGYSWEKAGQIWYDALYKLPLNPEFHHFAELTVDCARKRFPNEPSVAEVIENAWKSVGVLPQNSEAE